MFPNSRNNERTLKGPRFNFYFPEYFTCTVSVALYADFPSEKHNFVHLYADAKSWILTMSVFTQCGLCL